MKRVTGLAIACVLLGVSSSTRAVAGNASQDPCLSAPVAGQKLQRAGKLIEARAQFQVCARDVCPKVVVQACTRWLGEVDADLPSLKLSAQDERGQELSDVGVSIDGAATVPIGPNALAVDPGTHQLVFHRDGSPDVTRQVTVNAKDKNHEVQVTFASAPKPVSQPAVQTQVSTPAATTAPPSSATSRPVPVLAWVLGGVGAAAAVSFATFGTLGLAQRGGSDCSQSARHDVFTSCQDSAHTKFQVADVALGIGIVALGAAAWVYLKRPSVEQSSPSVAVGLRASPGGAVAAVGGSF
jgi:hypothetical protein